MSKYVAEQGYTGVAYPQSVIWHYKTDIDRNVLNRWFVNIFNQGVLSYTPDPDTVANPSSAGGSSITISEGTSFLIKQKLIPVAEAGDKIAKVDMVLDYVISVDGMNNDTYNIIAVWQNDTDEYHGVDFYLLTTGELIAQYITPGYNYIQLGTVVVKTDVVDTNTTAGQTRASMWSGLDGWSGYSGEGVSGVSGWSGTSGEPGTAVAQGDSGYSGYSGESGTLPGVSGYSGKSGWSGTSGTGRSGWSGTSGWSGFAGQECILVACSDEVTPLSITPAQKIAFHMPYAMIPAQVKLGLTTAGSTATKIDIKYGPGGLTLLNNGPMTTLPATAELTSIYTTPVVGQANLLPLILSDNTRITVEITQAGTGATGLKVYFIGVKL